MDDQEDHQGMSDFDDDDDDDNFDEDEDEDDGEQEVEHSTRMIDGKTMNIKCCSFDKCDGVLEDQFDTLLVVCSIEGKEIGRGFASYIERHRIISEFWKSVEGFCEQTSYLAFTLFDRYACLRPEFKEHPVRKGSGVWGAELDIGDLLLIEEISVDRDWQRKGVGTVILEHLNRMGQSGGKDRRPDMSNALHEPGLDNPNIPDLFKAAPDPGRNASFNLLIAGWLTRDIKDDCKGKLQSEQQRIRRDALNRGFAFYRSRGYRRVGNSNCFGLALDQTHPAHKLNASEDFDPIRAPISEDDDEEEVEGAPPWEPANYELEKMQRFLPIHHAIVTLPDTECLAFLKALDFPPSDSNWSKSNSSLNNILHIAAIKSKPQSVQWLLQTIDKIHRLSSAINEDGFTPVEAAQEALEINRTTLEHNMMYKLGSDPFTGFSDEARDVLLEFRALHNTTAPTAQELAALRFGCTCGECLGGFISPRMCLALKYQGEVLGDLLNLETDNAEMWLLMHEHLYKHVAPDIQQNFRTNKSLRNGYAKLFQRIATCLERKELPICSSVLHDLHMYGDEWPPNTKNYLNRGGKVEDALQVVFEIARDQDDYAGDGSSWDTIGDDFEKLKTCRNDHEFGFVALLCGLPDFWVTAVESS